MVAGYVVVGLFTPGEVVFFARRCAEFVVKGLLIAQPVNRFNEINHRVADVVLRGLVNYRLRRSHFDSSGESSEGS